MMVYIYNIKLNKTIFDTNWGVFDMVKIIVIIISTIPYIIQTIQVPRYLK